MNKTYKTASTSDNPSPLHSPSPFHAKNVLESFRFAWLGLKLAVQTQRNLRIHLLISMLVTTAGLWFGIQPLEWAVLILCMAVMLAVELLNTAIEWAVDLHTRHQWHELGGQIKDLAACACMILAVGCAVVGLIIFLPYFLKFFLAQAS